MAKKKGTQQKRQKEPCEEDTSDEELKSYTNAKPCPHIAKALNANRVKKALKNNYNLEKCKDCCTKTSEKVPNEGEQEESKEIWLCLQCGYCGCGRTSTNQHAMLHYKTPRSDCHALVLSTASMSVWCYMCDESVLIEGSRNLRECVEFIAKSKDRKPPANVMVNGSAKNSPKSAASEASAETSNKPEKGAPTAKPKHNETSGKSVASGKKPAGTATRAIKGLRNLGNTCFFNAVLQNMCQTPWLFQELEQRSEKGSVWEIPFLIIDNEIVQNEENPLKVPLVECGPLTSAFCNFLKQMKKPSQETKSEVVNPSSLFDQICKKSPQFRGFHQQDSHECLRHLLDGIRNEEIKRQKRAVLRKFKLEHTSPNEVDEPTKKTMKAYGSFASHTIVERIFGGQLMSTVVCEECKMSSQVFEPFMDLSLPLAEEKVMRTAKAHKQASGDDFGMHVISKPQSNENALSKHQERKMKQNAKKSAKKKAKLARSSMQNAQREQAGKAEEVKRNDEEEKPEHKDEKSGEAAENDDDDQCLENTSSIDGNGCEGSDDKEGSSHQQSDADVEDNDENEAVTQINRLYEELRDAMSTWKREPKKPCSAEIADCEVKDASKQAASSDAQGEDCDKQVTCPISGISEPSKPHSECQTKDCASDCSLQFDNCPSQKQKLTEQSDADVEDNDESETVSNNLCGQGLNPDSTGPVKQCTSAGMGDGSAMDCRIEELCDQITDIRIRQESERQEDLLGCTDDEEDTDGRRKRQKSFTASVSDETAADEWSHPQSEQLTKEWVKQSLTTLKARYQPSSQECSVNSCLNQFTASELLTGSNKFRCENCTLQRRKRTGDESAVVYSNASKQLLIFSPPAVLTLHLKRFQQTGASLRKLNLFVEFPEVLDLAPYCSSISLKLPHMDGVKDEVLYSLYGVVQHSGRLSSGHYTAFVKVGESYFNPSFLNAWPTSHCNLEQILDKISKITQNSAVTSSQTSGGSSSSSSTNVTVNSSSHKWYHISDSFFREVSSSEVFQCQAYILFYQRIK